MRGNIFEQSSEKGIFFSQNKTSTITTTTTTTTISIINYQQRQKKMKFSTILTFSALSVATTNAVDYDAAYIYSGCTLENGAFPEYATNADCQTNFGSDCEYGDGWYCNDGTDVSTIDSKDFDDSAIHSGCDTGVHFSLSYSKWYCKDDGPEGDVDSNSFIAKGCNDPDFPTYAKNDDCQK